MAYEDMQYWEQKRNDRLRERRGGAVEYGVPPFDGLVAWVAGEYIAGRELRPFLDVSDQDITEGPWLGADLVAIADRSGTPIPQRVAELRELIRGNPQAAGITDLRLAPHYVLTGEPKATVPRGTSDGPPAPAEAIAATTWTPWSVHAGLTAVVDSGVDPAMTWAGQVSDGTDDDTLLAADGSLASQAGHGTFVASLVQRAAAGGAPLRAIQVLDIDGTTTEQELVLGLMKLRGLVAGLPWVVVNLSLGGFTDNGDWAAGLPDLTLLDEDKNRLPLALGAELAHWAAEVPNAVFVAAAGNDSQVDRHFWPAALADAGVEAAAARPTFVAVASLDSGQAPSLFTNRGPWVSVSTLGEGLHGEYPHGVFKVTSTVTDEFQTGAARWSGTSFATALITGEIVRRARSGGVSAAQAWSDLDAASPSHGTAGLGKVFDPRGSNPRWDPRNW